VPDPPAADAVDTELRCDDEAFSILGMLIIRRKRRGREEIDDRN
jgi:hypothetical protein